MYTLNLGNYGTHYSFLQQIDSWSALLSNPAVKCMEVNTQHFCISFNTIKKKKTNKNKTKKHTPENNTILSK